MTKQSKETWIDKSQKLKQEEKQAKIEDQQSHAADTKSTPSYSSNLHLSVSQDRSEKGALIGSKIYSKNYKMKKRSTMP